MILVESSRCILLKDTPTGRTLKTHHSLGGSNLPRGLFYGGIIMKILLTQGKYAIVDASDYEWISLYRWYAKKDGHTYYALASSGKKIKMHRVILGAKEGQLTDHLNRNGLDNRRCNLRICTQSQNQANSQRSCGTSHFKGVYRRGNKWVAQIRTPEEPDETA